MLFTANPKCFHIIIIKLVLSKFKFLIKEMDCLKKLTDQCNISCTTAPHKSP